MVSPIVIRDYEYTPRYRPSLEESPFIQAFFANIKETDLVARVEQMAKYRDKLARISKDFNAASPDAPFWDSTWLPPFDGITLYTFLAEYNPRYYVECGSGNTTKFAARSIRDNNLRTKIISIDPYPRAEIDSLCHKIFRIPFEDMDIHFFYDLTDEDMLLVDNSHRSFPNSDVTVFFTEILPILPRNMLYALHDIFLPMDYPEEWNTPQKRYYNEQYLLISYLLGGAMGDSVYFPCCYSHTLSGVTDAVRSIFADKPGSPPMQHDIYAGGGLFWLKKGNTYKDLLNSAKSI